MAGDDGSARFRGRARRLFRVLSPVLAALLLASGCGRADGPVDWRGLELMLPAGWTVIEHSDQHMSMADGPLASPGSPGPREAAVYFTHEPGTTPADWRRFVTEQDGTLDTDTSIQIDGVPATQLVFTYETNTTLLREMVVIVPSRGVVGLFQPVVTKGSVIGPDRFDAHRGEFDRIVDSITFGAPPAAGRAA